MINLPIAVKLFINTLVEWEFQVVKSLIKRCNKLILKHPWLSDVFYSEVLFDLFFEGFFDEIMKSFELAIQFFYQNGLASLELEGEVVVGFLVWRQSHWVLLPRNLSLTWQLESIPVIKQGWDLSIFDLQTFAEDSRLILKEEEQVIVELPGATKDLQDLVRVIF